MDFRTIAIIAHVDHGKTTLVDAMLQQSNTFTDRDVIEDRVMDSNELEKERGITIYAKNASIMLQGTKVNIVDTPGHADFGSEVERVLRMVDSVFLLVDAYEGPMPQTKFVLRKSLALGLKPVVIINKIDKPTARPNEVLDMVLDLFVELGATEEQLNFPYIFTNAKKGIALRKITDQGEDLQPLFDMILDSVPIAPCDQTAQMRMQPANLAYDDYVGRLAVGRIFEGTISSGMKVTRITPNQERDTHKITKIFTFQGLNRIEVESAVAGDIVQIAGIPDVYVGDTIAQDPKAEALPVIAIDPPTLKMDIMVNNSPLAGREGTLITSRQIRDRLKKECETNVGLLVDGLDSGDVFTICGRGEMHISILLEQMRREGFELQVGQPQVILKEENGQKLEPIMQVIVDVPDAYAGIVIEKLGARKGEMHNIQSQNGSTRLEYLIPTRGLLGYKSEFITDTRGEGTLSFQFDHYGPFTGEIDTRKTGSIISGFDGITSAYSLDTIQARGPLFIGPGTQVYEGMVIGKSMKETIEVNPIKGKKLTNMRASGADMSIKLTPPLDMTLEKALEYIGPDELVEITPESIRIRKKFLKAFERKRHG
ncbi:MAG: translational GTPase TypA [Patescibacteria group bacterium]|nr:translational GTPase TypA [Patescibacteria group bacterium]